MRTTVTMPHSAILLLLLLLMLVPVTLSATTAPQTSTTTISPTIPPKPPTTGSPSNTSSPHGNHSACVFSPTTAVRHTLEDFLSTGASLVYIHLRFSRKTEKQPGETFARLEKDMGLFQPWLWQRSSSRQGRSLLMLSDHYDVLSLFLLSIRVQHLQVTLTASPPGCLANMTSHQVYESLLALLLNDFKAEDATPGSGSLSVDEHVCYQHLHPDQDNTAVFHYVCCTNEDDSNKHHEDEDEEGGEKEVELAGESRVCINVKQDEWIKVLMAAILIIKILVVLFSPNLLPDTLYRQRYASLPYVFHLPQQKKITLRMVKTKNPSAYGHDDRIVRFSKIPGMPQLRKLVDTWPEDRMYDVTLKELHLAIKARKLLAQNRVPVGAIKVLYNNLFLCRLRHVSSLTNCCNTGIVGQINLGFKVPTWFKCARIFARLLLVGLMVLPWVGRMLVYYRYERPLSDQKEESAKSAGLRMPFSGSFTLYLTPLHVMFLICYIIICLDSFIYGVLSEAVKEKMKLVLRRCLRDMRERSKISVCHWVTKIVVMPCTVCGLVGLLLLPLYLLLIIPIMVPVLAFYLFPAVNLSVRLILHVLIFLCPMRVSRGVRRLWHRFFSPVNRHMQLDSLTAEESFENRSSFKKWELPFQALVVLICLVSFWSLTFLLMELLSFLVEMAVYTFIGVIVTADVTSQYLSVIFFLILYGNTCFSAIHNKYLKYHCKLHDEVLSMMRAEIDVIARTAELDQENTALRVQGDMANASELPPATICVVEGRPRWTLSSVLLFLDRKDTPYTPERFFTDTINLNISGSPGELHENILSALWSFLQIIIFLLFVFVVVMAFGSAYSVSSTNQLLATVAGGFIPFVFGHFFSGSKKDNEVDKDSVQFKTQFHTAINTYKQNWPVFDIEPEDCYPSQGFGAASGDKNANATTEDKDVVTSTDNKDEDALLEMRPVSPAPTDKAADRPESVDWDNFPVDIIFDMSKNPRATRELTRMGEVEAGSQTMLHGGGHDSSGVWDKEKGGGGRAEGSQPEAAGLLHV